MENLGLAVVKTSDYVEDTLILEEVSGEVEPSESDRSHAFQEVSKRICTLLSHFVVTEVERLYSVVLPS